jgi:class 3 adenylate cyclase
MAMNRARLRRRLRGASWTVLIWCGTLFWALWVSRWPIGWWEGATWVIAVGSLAGFGVYAFEHSGLLWRTVIRGSTVQILALRVSSYVLLIGGSIAALSLLSGAPSPPCLPLPGLKPDPCLQAETALVFWEVVRIGTLAVALTAMAIVLNFGRELGSVVSPRTLLQILFELHRRPVVEHRVFMFLDLNDSTALAERMGPIGFALFKADFFRDLSDPVYASGGRILEYAGDEALLTWLQQDGRGVRAAVQCFFDFQELVRGKSARYMERHGQLPGFKASIAAGEVVAMSMGDLRTQRVFSGDPVNTAGRLLTRCRELDAQLLMPEELSRHLGTVPGLSLLPRGEWTLRGKTEPTTVLSVTQSSEEPSTVSTAQQRTRPGP